MYVKPINKPINPKFSSGPCSKPIDYDITQLKTEFLGRYHRHHDIKNLLAIIQTKLRKLLNIPQDFKIIFTPASATGAIEMLLWNLDSESTVDCLSWEYFGNLWAYDVLKQLKLSKANLFKANYGEFPDLTDVNFAEHDVLFTYCGTTASIIFPHEDQIPDDRKGLIMADATSYVLSKPINWNKIDALAFSWQKSLASEAQMGTLILSPRAVERLQNSHQTWPVPKIFTIKNKDGSLNQDILNGNLINTPSILTILDCIYMLEWIEKRGGQEFITQQISANFDIVLKWVNSVNWIALVSSDLKYQAKNVVCLKIVDEGFLQLDPLSQKRALNVWLAYLEDNDIAYDLVSHPEAPLGIRIWIGTTIVANDVEILIQWLNYSFAQLKDHQFECVG